MTNPVNFEGGLKSGIYETGQDIQSNKEPEATDKEKPGYLETTVSGIMRDNFITNNIWKLNNEAFTAYEGFSVDGYDSLSKEEREKYEPKYWPVLGTARTPQEAERKVSKVIEEDRLTDIVDRGPISGNLTSGAFNAVTSPFTYFPIARAAGSVKYLSSLKDAAKVMAPIAVGSTLEEANLQWTQENRNLEESLWNIATSTAMGGLLAGTGSALRTLKYKTYKDIVESTMKGGEAKFLVKEDGSPIGFNVYKEEGSSVGSAFNYQILLEDDKLLGLNKEGQITAAKPFFWLANKMGNPVVRGLMSKSGSTRSFINNAYRHNFDIVNESAYSGVASIQSRIADWRAKGVRHDLKLADFYYEQLGLDTQGNKIGNSIKSSFGGGDGYMSYDKFLERHSIAIINGGVDKEFPVIERAAKSTIDEELKPAFEALVASGKIDKDVNPYGAIQHLWRRYNKQGIASDRPNKERFLISKFRDVNEKITKEKGYLTELEERLGTELETSDTKKKIAKEKKRIDKDIIKNKYDPSMLIGDKGMSWEQLTQLKKLRNPINKASKAVKEAEENLRVHKRKINDGRLPGKKNVPADESQVALESKLKESKEHLKNLRGEYTEKVKNKQLDESLFFKTKDDNYRLRKANKGTRKLRPILDDQQLEISAKNAIDNILDISEEQLAQRLYGTFRSGSSGDFSQPRTLLIPDIDLYENGFLSIDTRKNVSAYLTKVGRAVELEKFFKSRGYVQEPDYLLKDQNPYLNFLKTEIHADYDDLRQRFESKHEEKLSRLTSQKSIDKLNEKAGKERIKLDEDMKNDILLVRKTLERLSGDFSEDFEGMIRTSRFLNNWAYASQLGALLLLGLQDAAAPLVRTTVKSYVNEGVLPFIKGLSKMNGDNKLLKESMNDIAIGIETLQAFNNQKFEFGVERELPMSFLERKTQGAANIMGIINGSNAWTDNWRVISGVATQSRLSRNLKQYLAGELKGNELAQLKVLRLDNIDMAKRIVSQLDKNGKPINGAYVPNLTLWEDGEAAQAFRTAIRHELDSTIFSGKDIASYPIQLDFHGVANSLLMFMGWGFNATANYFLPALQRFDVNKVQGLVAMAAIGMLVDPLRILSDGKELSEEDLEPLNLLKKGVLNSGILGTYSDVFNRFNAAFDILPSLQVDRFKNKGKLELISGAPYSFLNFVGTFAGQLSTNEWNKQDLKTMKRNTPLLHVLWGRKLSGEIIDSLDIPETRSKARKEKE